jgi:hypothetical protein
MDNLNSSDLAELETSMLAIVFEWLLCLPDEYLLPPGEPDQFSGEIGPADNTDTLGSPIV